MPIPQNKQELKDAVETEYQKLRVELDDIPTKSIRKKTVEGGISVADIVAYQIGWGKLLIGWYKTGKNKKNSRNALQKL